MRISDWSSDVCSSDLFAVQLHRQVRAVAEDVAQPRALARFRLRTGQPQREQAGGVVVEGFPFDIGTAKPVFALLRRSEERRVGKECVRRVDLGGRRIIKKKKNKYHTVDTKHNTTKKNKLKI